uniref:Alkylglycerol monooxygenase n=1 Tax=Parascaris univalens TaxID=6257 RepID=A0A915B548_PARUN
SKLTSHNLRMMFYLITPNESTFHNINDVPQYVDNASSWFLLMIFGELLILRLQQSNGSHAINDMVTSISAGMLLILFQIGGRLISLNLYIYVYNNYRILDLPIDSPITWFIGFLAEDFMYYLTHRAIHEAGIFWSFHQMHHSSEYYNLTTALRQSCLSDYGAIIFDLIQSFFVPPPIFLVHRNVNLLYQFWIHTEVITSLGPLEYILNTPSHHRVHHGRNPYCIDKNYGGTLIIWDRLFGTFEWEKGYEKPIYGLVKNVESFDQLYLQFFVLKELGWNKGQLCDSEGKPLFPGFVNKIKALLWPPNYIPGSRTKQFFLWRCMVDSTERIPGVDPKRARYDPGMSITIKVYVVLHFFIQLFTYLHFCAIRSTLSYAHSAISIALMVVAMQSFGYFFDKKRWAKRFEAIRLLLTSIYDLLLGNVPFAALHILSFLYLIFLYDEKCMQK